tara:strand:- start:325 stop:1005 length:681 start_codon:yes stop_codon:yes gene_type:complete
MSVLSFDIGIKNLCFCELNDKGKILDWAIVNISNDVPCEHKMKNGKCCDKPGTFIYKCKLDNSEMYLCTSHSKNKCYDKVKKFNNPKNNIFHISQNLVKKLDEFKFIERNITDVIVENQPSLKNPTMKSIQMIVYSYFLVNGICKDDSSIVGLEMINARNKLKVYKGEPIKCDIKETYKRNKYLAVKYCEKMIVDEEQKFIDLYNVSKKKDDLSDSYLQGIYYLSK